MRNKLLDPPCTECESLRHQLADEKLCHEETRERVADLEDTRAYENLIKYGNSHPEMYKTELDLVKEQLAASQEAERAMSVHTVTLTKETLLSAHAKMVEREEMDDLNTELDRLSRIEDVAMEVVTSEVWSGDEFYDKLCKLKDTLWST